MTTPNPQLDPDLPDWLKPRPVVPAFLDPALMAKMSPGNVEALSHVDPLVPRHDSPSEVVRMQYPIVFETILDRLAGGLSMIQAVQEDQRNINYRDFMVWILRSDERKTRYHEARKIAAEVVSEELIPIADGINPDGSSALEDVSRSNLRIDTRRKLMAVWDRSRFGEVKQIDATVVHENLVTFNLTRPPQDGDDARVIEGEVLSK